VLTDGDKERKKQLAEVDKGQTKTIGYQKKKKKEGQGKEEPNIVRKFIRVRRDPVKVKKEKRKRNRAMKEKKAEKKVNKRR